MRVIGFLSALLKQPAKCKVSAGSRCIFWSGVIVALKDVAKHLQAYTLAYKGAGLATTD